MSLDSIRSHRPTKILRFRRSERWMHWALAVPFLLCYASALALVVFYNPHPQRPYRELLSWFHRGAGISLIVLPMIAAVKSKGDFRIHFYNIRQAWVWCWEDFRWLTLMGAAAISSRVTLPRQGKFNAAEKLNFMVLMGTYPLYILTGLMIWLTDVAFLSWVIHVCMAVIATPLITGHIFMAVVNPGTRKGLEGMISGFVDRTWAKHHYERWYEDEHEAGIASDNEPARLPPSDEPALGAFCPHCSAERTLPADTDLGQLLQDSTHLICSACDTEMSKVFATTDLRTMEEIMDRFQQGVSQR